ncbi:MAG: hypothetical protein E5Y67_29510 [Mesorhizobium sp.]|uniref:hypothetical protein n=1 Tax=Mesorhizobium sp. TaxID=1871066 RepID=UPI00122B9207|nr:hypothetical protein [Mesorhizobium sp.]TIM07750.1 MAG: hypothetical protein E5Y67_29510 [Mesorhizobium sp.]
MVQAGRFAHFLNGYEVAGGVNPLADLSNAMSAQARKTGKWEGSALDLWLCFFSSIERIATRVPKTAIQSSTFCAKRCVCLLID